MKYFSLVTPSHCTRPAMYNQRPVYCVATAEKPLCEPPDKASGKTTFRAAINSIFLPTFATMIVRPEGQVYVENTRKLPFNP